MSESHPVPGIFAWVTDVVNANKWDRDFLDMVTCI